MSNASRVLECFDWIVNINKGIKENRGPRLRALARDGCKKSRLRITYQCTGEARGSVIPYRFLLYRMT